MAEIVKTLFVSAASVMPRSKDDSGVAVVATLAVAGDREVARLQTIAGVGYAHATLKVICAALRGLADGQTLELLTDIYYVREMLGTERAQRRNRDLADLEHLVLQAVRSERVRIIRTLSDGEWSLVNELHSMARSELSRLRPGQVVYPDRG